jgi:hypothetical protein
VGFELLRQRASEGRKKKEEGKKKMNVPGPLNEEGREEKRMEGHFKVEAWDYIGAPT